MIKRFLFVLLALLALQTQAQEGTASPYSFYGIGSLKFKGTVENISMGGLSIYTDSIHVNLRNPASYATENLKLFGGTSRPVKFAIGGSHNTIKLKAQDSDDKTSATSFDYIALSIPMGKFGAGFGLLPYTSVGYKLETYNDIGVENRFKGSGGVNKAYLSLAYLITDGLSVGVDANYNFGNIKNSSIEFDYDVDGNLVQYQSREENRSDLSGLNYNFGLSYKTMISPKLELVTGLTYTPKSTLVSKNERAFSTIVISSTTGQEYPVETVDDVLTESEKETDLTMPSKFSFGAGIGQPKKWFFGAEYESQKTSQFKNDFLVTDATVYEDGSRFSLGGFYIPDYKSLSSYWNRVVYRAGLRFENTGLNIESETINEFGMSFGVGLPVGRLFSNANIGVEIGKRGTTKNYLIQENFVNFHISLSLNDKWFEKRKYD